jgi:tetratricopeptide (TPR) repeat protein
LPLFRPFRAASRAALAAALALAVAAPLPALAQDSPGLTGAYLAARAAERENDFDAAARYYGRALLRDPRNPAILEKTVLAHLGQGNLTRAVPVARTLRQTGSDSQIGTLALVADQIAREDWDAVLNDLSAGMTVGPLIDGLIKGWARLGSGDEDGAMDAFDEVSETAGLSAFGLYHKALALAVEGEFDAAQEVFASEGGQVLALTRRGAVAQAQVLSELGRNEDALALIAEGFGQTDAPVMTDLRTRLEAGETVPFTLVADARAGAAEAFFSVAAALDREASDDYTLLYSRIAEALDETHVDAILLSGELLDRLERYDLAQRAYNRVPGTHPSFHVAEIGRAEALLRSGQEERAIEVMAQLAETHGDIAGVHVELGDMLRGLERYDAASEAYDAAIAMLGEPRPEHWIVYFTRGITHEREGRWPEAEADFRTSLGLNPGQPSVLNYLGYSLVDMNMHLEEALGMIEEAVAARPDSGHIVDSLGWALYRLGRYDEAVGHMERAAELLPVDPIVNDHLGDVYWAVGRETEARFQWHRALSFGPEPDEAERIRRKLEVGLDAVLAEEGAPALEMAGDDG